MQIKTLVSAVALAALASLPLTAQQPSSSSGAPATASPQTTPQNTPGTHSDPAQVPQPQTAQPDPGASQGPGSTGSGTKAEQVPHTANAPEVGNADLRPVKAELASTLDTKKVKNGDQVVLKTTEKASTASGVVIPKGSKIVGRVVDVKAHDASNQNSKVTLQFDQAELKGGQTLPIKSVIQSVEPAEGYSGSEAALPAGGGAPSAPSGGAASGGAPMSGGSSGSSGSMSGSTQARQAPMQQGNSSVASPGVASGPTPGTVVAQQGNIEIKTTAVPGVLIAGNVNGQPFSNASGALLGARQNVHLDGGTKVVLAIADANTKASNR